MDVTQIFGWIATFLFSIMLIPQIVKTIKVKDTSGVSLLLFIIYLLANIVAIIYAFMINQMPLIIKYGIAIAITIFYLILYLIYYSATPSSVPVPDSTESEE
jgi:MtN3 and saliva related transmembrane protein